MTLYCPTCSHALEVGDWPFCPHGKVQPRGAFEPHFDYGIGKYVTGWGDVKQAMRADKLDFRDHPTPGDKTARLDRIADVKRRQKAS